MHFFQNLWYLKKKKKKVTTLKLIYKLKVE
jgi:hypothetical protein